MESTTWTESNATVGEACARVLCFDKTQKIESDSRIRQLNKKKTKENFFFPVYRSANLLCFSLHGNGGKAKAKKKGGNREHTFDLGGSIDALMI